MDCCEPMWTLCLDKSTCWILWILEVLWTMGSRVMDNYGSWMFFRHSCWNLKSASHLHQVWSWSRRFSRFRNWFVNLGQVAGLVSRIDRWSRLKRHKMTQIPQLFDCCFLSDLIQHLIQHDCSILFQSTPGNFGMISNDYCESLDVFQPSLDTPRTGLEAWQVFVRISSWRRRTQWGRLKEMPFDWI